MPRDATGINPRQERCTRRGPTQGTITVRHVIGNDPVVECVPCGATGTTAVESEVTRLGGYFDVVVVVVVVLMLVVAAAAAVVMLVMIPLMIIGMRGIPRCDTRGIVRLPRFPSSRPTPMGTPIGANRIIVETGHVDVPIVG